MENPFLVEFVVSRLQDTHQGIAILGFVLFVFVSLFAFLLSFVDPQDFSDASFIHISIGILIYACLWLWLGLYTLGGTIVFILVTYLLYKAVEWYNNRRSRGE